MMYDGTWGSRYREPEIPDNYPKYTDFISQEERDKFRKLMNKDIMFSYLLRFLIKFSDFLFISTIVILWVVFWFLPFILYVWPYFVPEGSDGFGCFTIFVFSTIFMLIIHAVLFSTFNSCMTDWSPLFKNFVTKYLSYGNFHYRTEWKYNRKRCTYYQLLLKLYDNGY